MLKAIDHAFAPSEITPSTSLWAAELASERLVKAEARREEIYAKLLSLLDDAKRGLGEAASRFNDRVCESLCGLANKAATYFKTVKKEIERRPIKLEKETLAGTSSGIGMTSNERGGDNATKEEVATGDTAATAEAADADAASDVTEAAMDDEDASANDADLAAAKEEDILVVQLSPIAEVANNSAHSSIIAAAFDCSSPSNTPKKMKASRENKWGDNGESPTMVGWMQQTEAAEKKAAAAAAAERGSKPAAAAAAIASTSKAPIARSLEVEFVKSGKRVEVAMISEDEEEEEKKEKPKKRKRVPIISDDEAEEEGEEKKDKRVVKLQNGGKSGAEAVDGKKSNKGGKAKSSEVALPAPKNFYIPKKQRPNKASSQQPPYCMEYLEKLQRPSKFVPKGCPEAGGLVRFSKMVYGKSVTLKRFIDINLLLKKDRSVCPRCICAFKAHNADECKPKCCNRRRCRECWHRHEDDEPCRCKCIGKWMDFVKEEIAFK